MTNEQDLNANLMAEMQRGDEYGVRFELARGADVNLCDDRGLSLLHQASRDGHAGVVKALVDGGAKLDMEDPAGDTPLHYAVWGEHKGVVDVLIAAGADPNHANHQAQRPVDIGSARTRRHLLPEVFEVTGQRPVIR
jgi:ankyrin repeat protein